MKRTTRFISALLIAVLLSFTGTEYAYAALAWFDTEDSVIYQGGEDTSSLGGMTDEEMEMLESLNEDGDIVTGLLKKFMITLGNSICRISAQGGITLDAIIYGRVMGSSARTDGVPLFSYDLGRGNVYGAISMHIFSLMSVLMLFVGIAILLFRITGFLYSGGGPQSRSKLKSSISTLTVIVLSVALFPPFLDLLIYIRDLILFQVAQWGAVTISEAIEGATENVTLQNQASSLTSVIPGIINSILHINGPEGGKEILKAAGMTLDFINGFTAPTGSYSLISQFHQIADESIFNAFLYVGVNCISFYFMFVYIGAAMAMCVLVAFFPLACVMEFYERGFLGGWVKQMVGILMIPVIDASLLIIPLMIGAFGIGADGKLAFGYALVEFVCFSSIIPARGFIRRLLGFGGSQAMEMAGLGAMLGTVMMARNVGRQLRNAYTERKNMQEEAKEDSSSSLSYQEQARAIDFDSEEKEQQASEAAGESIDFEPLDEEELGDMSVQERAFARTQNVRAGKERIDSEIDAADASIQEKQGCLNEINGHVRDIDAETAELKATKTRYGFGSDDALQVERKIAENMSERQKYMNEAAFIKEGIADDKAKRDELLKSSRSMGKVLGDMERANAASGADKVNVGLDETADIDNFESDAYRNISIERRAELYQERAKERDSLSRRKLTGTVTGAAVGGTLGFAGTTLSPSSTKAMVTLGMTSAGAGVGGSIGGRRAVLPEQEIDVSARPERPDYKGRYGEADKTAARTYYDDPSRFYDAQGASFERNYHKGDKIYSDKWWEDMYEGTWNSVVLDPYNAREMEECARRSLRDIAVKVRETGDPQGIELRSMAEPEPVSPKEFRDKELDTMINEAAGKYADTIIDAAISRGVIPEWMSDSGEHGFSETKYKEHVKARVEENAKSQIRRYLKAKHLK